MLVINSIGGDRKVFMVSSLFINPRKVLRTCNHSPLSCHTYNLLWFDFIIDSVLNIFTHKISTHKYGRPRIVLCVRSVSSVQLWIWVLDYLFFFYSHRTFRSAHTYGYNIKYNYPARENYTFYWWAVVCVSPAILNASVKKRAYVFAVCMHGNDEFDLSAQSQANNAHVILLSISWLNLFNETKKPFVWFIPFFFFL